MIKVNVNLHNRRPGSIVKATDKDFKVFKAYAEKKSTRNGMVICEFQDTGKFDRPATVARLEELGVEFRGNMSNDNMAQLLIDSEAAALDKGDIRLSRDFVVNKLNELEVDFDESMSDDDLEQLMRDTEEQLAEAAAGGGDQDENEDIKLAEFDRATAIQTLNELEVDFNENLSDEGIRQLLEEVGSQLHEVRVEDKAPAEFNRATAMARLKELDIEFKGNISNVDLEQLLKDTEEGLLAAAGSEDDKSDENEKNENEEDK